MATEKLGGYERPGSSTPEELRSVLIDDQLDDLDRSTTMSSNAEAADPAEIEAMHDKFDTDYKTQIEAIVSMLNVNIHHEDVKRNLTEKIRELRNEALSGSSLFEKNKMRAVFYEAIRTYKPIQKAYKAYIFHPLKEYFSANKDLRETLVENYKNPSNQNVKELFQGPNAVFFKNFERRNPIEDLHFRIENVNSVFKKDMFEGSDIVFKELTTLESTDSTFGNTTSDQLHTLLNFYLNDAVLFGNDTDKMYRKRLQHLAIMEELKLKGLSEQNYSMENPLTGAGGADLMDVEEFLNKID